MANEQLEQYIETEKKRGVPVAAIQQALLDAGWDETSVTQALNTPSMPAQQPMASAPHTTAAAPDGIVDMFDHMDATPAGMTAGAASTTPMQSTPATTMATQPLTATVPTTAKKPFFAGNANAEIQNGLTSRKKIILAAVGVAILIALIGGGIYAYTSIYGSSARAYGYAMNNIVNLKSASYNLVIAPQFTSPITNPLTGRQVTDANIQMTGILQGLATATPASTTVATAKLNGSGTDSYQAELRMINNVTYAQLGALTGVSESVQSVLTAQWFSMTSQSLAAVDTSGLGVDGRAIKQFSQSEITQMKSAVQSSNVLQPGGREGTENIQGIDTVKYSMTVASSGVDAFLSAIKPLLSSRGMTDSQVTQLAATLKQGGDIQGFVWIGKKDYQLYQVQFIVNTPQSKTTKLIAVSLTLWDHNSDLKVELPTPVKPLDTVLLELQRNGSALTDETTEPAQISTQLTEEEIAAEEAIIEEEATTNTSTSVNATTNTNVAASSNINATDDGAVTVPGNDPQTSPTADPDADGLTNVQEEQYGTDPNDSDSDDDGFSDGDEVRNGYDPSGDGKLAE